jgi:hypothetical protein
LLDYISGNDWSAAKSSAAAAAAAAELNAAAQAELEARQREQRLRDAVVKRNSNNSIN